MSGDRPATSTATADATPAFQGELFQGDCSSGFCADRKASADVKKGGDCAASGGGCSGGSCSKGNFQSALGNMPGVGILGGLAKAIGRLFG